LKDELKTQVQGIAQSVQSARSGGTR
jgi:hypothetical protein